MLGFLKTSFSVAWALGLLLLVQAAFAADAGDPGPSGQRGRPASSSPEDKPTSKRPTTDIQHYQTALQWSNIFLKIYPGPQAQKETYRDLERWGWKRVDANDVPITDLSYLQHPLQMLHLDSEPQQHSRVCFSLPRPRGSLSGGFLEPPTPCLDQFMYLQNGVLAVMEMIEPNEEYAVAQNAGEHKLDQWQDVMAVTWQSICQDRQTTENACSHLQWVLMTKVMETDVLDIMEIALGRDWTKIHVWPGVAFPAYTEPGKALLGTHFGQRVAKLIAEHQDMFPNKIVTDVVVYDPLDSLHAGTKTEGWLTKTFPGLAFYIGDHTGSGSYMELQTAHQTLGVQWEQAVTAGTVIVSALDSGIGMQPQSQMDSLVDVDRYGWHLREGDIPAFNKDAVRAAFEWFGLPLESRTEGYLGLNHVTVLKHQGRKIETDRHSLLTKWKVSGVEYQATMAHYTQSASPKHGVLTLQSSETMQQAAASMTVDVPVNFPRLDWSDLGLAMWKQACETAGVHTKAPEYIFVVGITDPATVAIADRVRHSDVIRTLWAGTHPNSEGMEFSPDSEAGRALIGSPLGQQASGMLGHHRIDFPQSSIDMVYLYYIDMDWADQPRRTSTQPASQPPGPVQSRPCLVFHITKRRNTRGKTAGQKTAGQSSSQPAYEGKGKGRANAR
ncbi:Mitochondrial import inner membrane translocase subunit tim8 [Recurvomyces mirabilis]|nr:Mitochondrial import inner membrane translocase subunit tim8 [Recurvomyces mirabilis]